MDEESLHLIEKYLDGRLNEEEERLFRAKMESDPEFTAAVKIEEEIEAAYSDENELELEEKLQTLFAEKTSGGEIKTFNMRRFYTVAVASVMLIVGIAAILNWSTRPKEGLELFGKYYEPYGIPQNLRSDDIQADRRGVAFELYEKGEYEGAIKKFQQIDSLKPGLPWPSLYIGICLIEIGDGAEARSSLQKTIVSGPHAFINQAEWYLGLSYLKENKTDSAKVIFESLSQKSGKYPMFAKELLEEL